MKGKKFTLGMALAMTLVLISVGALAAGLVFSGQYQHVLIAKAALKAEYALTDEMVQMFTPHVSEADGKTRVVFSSGSERMGVYTAIVENGQADVSWSHDGRSDAWKQQGLEADIWGAPQLQLKLEEYAKKQGEKASTAAPRFEILAQAFPGACPEEGRITGEQALALARKALMNEYEIGGMYFELESAYHGETDTWYIQVYGTEGMGYVEINAQNGEILMVHLDSGAMGNG